MPSKPKTARREHSSETIAIVVALHEVHLSYAEIARQVRLARSTVVTIVHRAKRQADASSVPKKRTGRPTKLNVRARRALIRHVEKNPHDNLLALTTPSKSGQKLSRVTVRKYLKLGGYFRFRARKKPFLSARHKAIRLKWGKEHKHWTVEDWGRVIWTDEATFETGLDTRSCYVTRRKGTAMESRYLKPTFKSGRSTVGIWASIRLGEKGPMLVLNKGRRMNSDIYIDEVLRPLGLSFYEACLTRRGLTIWMDDGASYHTSKKVIDWGRRNGLLRMDWPPQSPDLNPIENLWRIIKIRVSARRHQIHTIEAMEQAIREEWALLTEEDFRRCIESMPERIRFLIKAKGGSIKY